VGVRLLVTGQKPLLCFRRMENGFATVGLDREKGRHSRIAVTSRRQTTKKSAIIINIYHTVSFAPRVTHGRLIRDDSHGLAEAA
jgi:hypothetical protein